MKKNQVIFKDIDSKTGKEKNKWRLDKKQNLLLGDSYERQSNISKLVRVRSCATYLQFKKFKIDDSLKLTFANFCQCRLCPMCAKRRSLKVFAHISKIMNVILNDYSFLFLTLTLENCTADDLGNTITLITKSFDKMFRRKSITKISKGWFRALEVTYNKEQDTFHPHLHIIIAVPKSYFKNKDYLKQEQWTKLWKESLKVDYTPIVHIKRFNKNKNIGKSVSEVAKYTVKSSDYLIKGNNQLTDKLVATLDDALAYRRLIAYGGRLKEVHKDLNLDDSENGDLVNVDLEDEVRFDDFMILNVKWNIGLSNYFVDEEVQA
jgi:plasmid rolling circle replication initiator protein Rep